MDIVVLHGKGFRVRITSRFLIAVIVLLIL
jgi:hypothetical protein